ncbi:MAG: hypothetical protein HOO97_11460 [Sideroxydans sp.]|nr:hypothetical protein [Sideroxydans sp.]
MSPQRKFRSTAELGLAVAAISALVLGGCGGGTKTTGTTPVVTPPVAAMTCSSGSVTGVAAANCLITEMTTATGARVDWAGGAASWVEPSRLVASVSNAGAYTLTFNYQDINPAGTAWVTPTYPGGFWDLTSNGWVADLTGSVVETLTHSNGVLSVTSPSSTYKLTSISKTDLSGQGVVCKNGPRVDIAAPNVACTKVVNYPNGAAAYRMIRTYLTDSYYLADAATFGGTDVITNSAGVALTSLPAISSTFCINGAVFVPVAPAPTAGADNYNVHPTADGTCGATVITNALAAGAASTSLVGSQTVNGAAMLTTTSLGVTNIAAFNVQAGNRFMTGGQWRTAGAVRTRDYVNKVAANAQLTAHGLPVLP